MSWTDERVDLLARLWSEGLSASQIAGQLGGVTRNAVIGKVHRLKLEGRVKTAIQETAKPKAVAEPEQDINETIIEIEMPVSAAIAQPMLRSVPRPMGGGMQGAAALKLEPDEEFVATPEPARPMVAGEVVPISRNLTLVQLSDRTCKWPLGDPLSPDFRFCGNHSNDASPYCQYHAKIAFQPVSERRRVR